MKEVIILFSTDQWHSHNSKDILGVFSEKEKAIEFLKEYEDSLSDDVYIDLQLQNQTQGLDKNFIIEEYELDLKP